jgi:hypothetical protein
MLLMLDDNFGGRGNKDNKKWDQERWGRGRAWLGARVPKEIVADRQPSQEMESSSDW